MFAFLQVQQHIVQVVFSITFSFSCTMFELIIFEILGTLSSRSVCFIEDSKVFVSLFMKKKTKSLQSSYLCHSSRYFYWRVNLYVILFVLIFVVPFYIGYFVVSNIRLCKYCKYNMIFVHKYKTCVKND